MKRDQKKERRIRTRLYEKHGHLIGCKTEDIPVEHRSPRGGLRCFKKIIPRDKNGNKLYNEERKRCGNNCARGSLYCKKHGGANTKSLVKGTRTSLDLYKGAYNHEVSNVLTTFLSDPSILDHKMELATLRTMLTQYIERYSNNKPVHNPRKLITYIQEIIESDKIIMQSEKFMLIKQIVDNETSLTDGNVIDRITRLVENIGKSIERIDRIERKSDYFLTPEGFKIVLRTIIELVNTHVTDVNAQDAIRKGLTEASTRTSGEMKGPVVDAEITYENEPSTKHD